MSDAPRLSIVVPTYREADNIALLVNRIVTALAAGGLTYEVIIADDDSGDGTKEICAKLAGEFPLRLLSRTSNRGLSPAVIDGIGVAQGEAVIVMDADLSHPPEKIQEMAALLLSGESDFVVGSRYIPGGGMGSEWPWWRLVNSLAATLPARFIAPLRDPMSGFFGLRRADMPPADQLSPIGYKIGLELLVKAGFTKDKVREVPIMFRDRQHGESKLTLKEQINYLRHLRRLYHYRWPKKLEVLQFIAVGCVGLIVDIAVYQFMQYAGLPHRGARAISYWPAVTSNWYMNRKLTFKHRPPRPRFRQWMEFVSSSGIGFFVNWGTYWLLTEYVPFFAAHLLLALLAGVIVGTVSNFLLADKLVFRA